MRKWVSAALDFSEQLLKRRWYLVGLTSLIVLLVEYEEHRPFSNPHQVWDYTRESFIFGLILPFTYGILLSLLLRTRVAKEDAERDLDQKYSFVKELNQSDTWQSLTSTIVAFPASIVPVVGTTLRIFNPATGNYELVDHWTKDGLLYARLLDDMPGSICSACTAKPSQKSIYLTPCNHFSDEYLPRSYSSYCLPLTHRDETIAVLHLHFPSEPTMISQQVRVLNGAAPEMALALENARLKQSASTRADAANAERKRIARDLHDTLGQNISYLRMKLDQLTGDDMLYEISLIHDELERMRDIADDAYSQVRQTLVALNPANDGELTQNINAYIRKITSRVQFVISLSSSGESWQIPPIVKRQVLFIFMEALNNIEKHAQAKQVDIHLNWSTDKLVLRIVDDGVGFDQRESREGHFGLGIMRERAADIRATLDIQSSPGEGTVISLDLPLEELSPKKTLVKNNNDANFHLSGRE